MDIVSKEARSRIMSMVGQKNTGPEILLRSALHETGLRYRLHDRTLPGSPDLVFPRFRSVVFIHGCYWHSHGCHRSTVPKSRREFWEEKFRANRRRDARDAALLRERGWRVMIVWECALIGKHASEPKNVAERVRVWLAGVGEYGEVSGNLPETNAPKVSESWSSQREIDEAVRAAGAEAEHLSDDQPDRIVGHRHR